MKYSIQGNYLVTDISIRNKPVIFDISDVYQEIYNKKHYICSQRNTINSELKAIIIYISYNDSINTFELKDNISDRTTPLNLDAFISTARDCVERKTAIKNHDYIKVLIDDHLRLIFKYLLDQQKQLLTGISVKGATFVKECNSNNTILVSKEFDLTYHQELDRLKLDFKNPKYIKNYFNVDINKTYIEVHIEDLILVLVLPLSRMVLNTGIVSTTIVTHPKYATSYTTSDVYEEFIESNNIEKYLTVPKIDVNKYMINGYL